MTTTRASSSLPTVTPSLIRIRLHSLKEGINLVSVVISRAFFFFFPCNHIINIHKKKNSFSGEVKDSVIFPFIFYFTKELNLYSLPPAHPTHNAHTHGRRKGQSCSRAATGSMPHKGLTPAPANMRVCMFLHYVRNYVQYVVLVCACARMC